MINFHKMLIANVSSFSLYATVSLVLFLDHTGHLHGNEATQKGVWSRRFACSILVHAMASKLSQVSS